MKNTTKLKRYIKKNNGQILIISLITIIGIAANINILLLPSPIFAEITMPTHKIKTSAEPLNNNGIIREITMYTSRVEETDSTPCISADGTDICKVDYNVCATNAFPIGTKLNIDKLGDCIVKDRMNKRYKERVDWYAKMDLTRALSFGKQNLKVIKID